MYASARGFEEENLKDQASRSVSHEWDQWRPALFLRRLLCHLLLQSRVPGLFWGEQWFKGCCDVKRRKKEMPVKEQQLTFVPESLNFCMGGCCCAVASEELL